MILTEDETERTALAAECSSCEVALKLLFVISPTGQRRPLLISLPIYERVSEQLRGETSDLLES